MSKEYDNNENSGKLPKLSNIYLQVDFLTDPKILTLLDEWGDKGLVALMALYFALAKERGAQLEIRLARAVLTQQRGWQKDEAEKFISWCCTEGLFVLDASTQTISCTRLKDEQSRCNTQQLKWRERQRLLRSNKNSLNSHADVTRDTTKDSTAESPRCLNNEYMNSEIVNNESSSKDRLTVSPSQRLTVSSLETRGNWLKMLPDDWRKLEETYGPEATHSAALEADEWIDLNRAHDKNARKYSKSTYNNKLFLRNWIARKKTGPPRTNGHKPTTMEINREMFEQIAREEADERARKTKGSEENPGLDLLRVGKAHH